MGCTKPQPKYPEPPKRTKHTEKEKKVTAPPPAYGNKIVKE